MFLHYYLNNKGIRMAENERKGGVFMQIECRNKSSSCLECLNINSCPKWEFDEINARLNEEGDLSVEI